MRLTGYQAGPRWQGVRQNITMISTYLGADVKTAIDIGSNEGVITCAVGELGVQAKGFEQNNRYNSRAERLGRHLGNKATFENKLVTIDDINAMGDIDAIMFLSVHHQIAAHGSLDAANDFLRALAQKAKHQLFFQPACIKAKYNCDVPFADNDYAAVEAYFNTVLKDEMPHTKTIGFAQNDMPKNEPMRPMIVYSREPVVMQPGRDTAGILETMADAVGKVHSFGNSIKYAITRR